MANLVFSYSHADEDLRNELEKHLMPFRRLGKINTWHDRRIEPGQEFGAEIDKYFAEADVVLLLISSDFIFSDYCYDVEMKNALKRHERGEAVVIPVILRDCIWHQLPFGKLLAATVDGKPVTKFSTLDEGFTQVAAAVGKVIDQINAKNAASSSVTSPRQESPAAVSTVFTPRSSNLSLPRHFSDLDKDRACFEGFDYVARYFENTLDELKRRHSGIETDFRRVDADSFSCSVYMDGKRLAQCGVWRGLQQHAMGDICYGHDAVARNSCNESLGIGDNGQTLGFRPLMGSYFGKHSQEPLLTNEGMSEHLWEMFLNTVKSRMPR
ncbi:TPA: toll/interleukin-1 receptor domain-containing protein [Serratia fonticola]|nr:toll/interleukin-1 receptor domain-containing protein [Serratia fonticola]